MVDPLACHDPDLEPHRFDAAPPSGAVRPPEAIRWPRVIDVLRLLGLVRKDVPRAVVGPRAFVRWWERIGAAVVLAAIVAGLGVALAAVIGVTVVGAGFLLEQAIS